MRRVLVVVAAAIAPAALATAPAPAAPLRPVATVDWVTSDWERYVAYARGPRLTVLDTATRRRRTFPWRERCSAHTGDGRNAAAGRVLASCGGPSRHLLDLRTGRLRRIPAPEDVRWDSGWMGRRLLTGWAPCESVVQCTVAIDLRTWRLTRRDDAARIDPDRAPPRPLRVCPPLREHVLELDFPYENRRSIAGFGRERLALRDCAGRTRTLAPSLVSTPAVREDRVSWNTGGVPGETGVHAPRPRLFLFDARRGRRRSWPLPVTGTPCPGGDPRRTAYGVQAHTSRAVVWVRALPTDHTGCAISRWRLYLGR